MAHIFKNPTSENKGIIVLTHQEVGFILNNQDTHANIIEIKNKYFIGVHYGGYSYGVKVPTFCDFYFGLPSVIGPQPHVYHIPLASGNFTAPCFNPDPDNSKYWDIINVSRNGNVKNLRLFFREVKKIYDMGLKYKILLVCASREEEVDHDHFTDIADVYYDMFTKEERDLFTLMRLGKDLEFKGLSKKQLSYFYQSSKVATLFSKTEGFPGVICEALLTGLPVVIWSGQRGSAKDFLNNTNSILFNNFDEAHLALIEAVKNYKQFDHDHDSLLNELGEEESIKKLKNHFSKIYSLNEQKYDYKLINQDDLVSRLPAHYVPLPWANNRHHNGHIKTVEQFNVFTKEILSF